MKQDKPNRRRRQLLITTSALGLVGVGFAAVPFIQSMQPSARALAIGGPVEVDISSLEMGQLLTVAWRGKPVWVLRRSQNALNRLKEIGNLLVDPESKVESQQPPYAHNLYRSIKPELLVVVGICTHLGCVPQSRFVLGPASGISDDWPGGFLCPCHGSKFDLAGRVFKNVPAPINLLVPPYFFLSDTRIRIGEDPLKSNERAK